jgi:hypothetical protein
MEAASTLEFAARLQLWPYVAKRPDLEKQVLAPQTSKKKHEL